LDAKAPFSKLTLVITIISKDAIGSSGVERNFRKLPLRRCATAYSENGRKTDAISTPISRYAQVFYAECLEFFANNMPAKEGSRMKTKIVHDQKYGLLTKENKKLVAIYI